MEYEVQEFVRDRDNAMIAFVMHDDVDAIKRYCKKYCVPMPIKPEVMAAGIYKAVQEITNIPEEVKRTAYEKCVKLGFEPFSRVHHEGI